MKRPALSVRLMGCLVCAIACGGVRAESTEPATRQAPYQGDEASGERIIAYWQFDTEAPTRDSSGKGRDLRLRGPARFIPDGRFGGGLESFAADKEGIAAGGAVARNAPELSPVGAFTIDLWFQPKPEIADQAIAFLVDKKYYHYARDLPQANWDYCLYLQRAGAGQRQLVANLGYGKDSAVYSSRSFELRTGQWHHLAFTYDGAGTGRFFVNGRPAGRTTHEGRGPITPGRHDIVLGDRYGSLYVGCAGVLDEVRLCNGIAPGFGGTLEIDMSGQRLAFLRGEADAAVGVKLFNDTGETLTGVQVHWSHPAGEQNLAVRDIAPHSATTVRLPVDTKLRASSYPWTIAASASAGQRAQSSVDVVIAPRPLPHRMPVVMWGTGQIDTVQEIGFTHQLVSLADYSRIWQSVEPTAATTPDRVAEMSETLDTYLARGLGAVANLSPGRWVLDREPNKEKFQRVDPKGKPYERENVCGLFPEVQAFAYRTGSSVAQTFGPFPALQAALIHTEIRDSTALCFHEHDRTAYRAATGAEFPDAALGVNGVNYTRLADFPASRVIPDDDPLLRFYRWFWKEGDGWNALHSQVHRGLKSTGRSDLWTFFDPAVRVPSVWGSGGEVDVISQWTYSYPDPIKIGQATDELLAMAEGAASGQRVMKMTQIIWYRNQTAPELPADESRRAAWEEEIPDARFITIAPDHLREAFWSKIARPIQGIMYHGWGSLVSAEHGSYRFTNPQTRGVLAELIGDVVRPLGPTLVQLPDRPSDVALLESFASQMFAGRGTRGWSHRWESDMHLILQWAQMQPRIVFDETVLRDGLDDYRILVMPYCDVLTENVAAAVAGFQKRGGIVIADETLAPGIRADLTLASYQRTGKADEDKTALQAKAAELREKLGSRYQRYADSSDPDAVLRARHYDSTDYLFVINDKRTFGEYVGHHGKVMEQGMPLTVDIQVNRRAGFVYDLVRHERIATRNDAGGMAMTVGLGPGDGRVLMISEQEIAGVTLEAPEQARLGETIAIALSVVDGNDEPLAAVVPLHVSILDPQGREAEFSGYYGAKDGRLSVQFELAANDLPGTWTIRARELASSRQQQRTIKISP